MLADYPQQSRKSSMTIRTPRTTTTGWSTMPAANSNQGEGDGGRVRAGPGVGGGNRGLGSGVRRCRHRGARRRRTGRAPARVRPRGEGLPELVQPGHGPAIRIDRAVHFGTEQPPPSSRPPASTRPPRRPPRAGCGQRSRARQHARHPTDRGAHRSAPPPARAAGLRTASRPLHARLGREPGAGDRGLEHAVVGLVLVRVGDRKAQDGAVERV